MKKEREKKEKEKKKEETFSTDHSNSANRLIQKERLAKQ